MKINEILKTAEDTIYGQYEEINGVRLKRYLPFAEKIGLANRIFSSLYQDKLYDSVNGKMFVPVMLFKELTLDIDFGKESEMDVDGIYDYLFVSGTMENKTFYSQVKEMEDIICRLTAMNYRAEDNTNSFESLIKSINEKTPEDISKMNEEVAKIMKNQDIRKMIDFSGEKNG